MNRILIALVIAVLLAASVGAAHAMARMEDEEMAEVHGRDGVTIASDLNIHIGSFVYSTQSTNNPNGGSIAFNDIKVTGLFAMTVDVLSANSFTSAMSNSMAAYGADGAAGIARLISSGLYDNRSDVIQLAIPNAGLDHRLSPSISVGSVTMGNSSASFGSFSLTNLDMQGSKVWIWAR
ncbi:MAG: hypothetical protein K2W93_05980 [Burkholderiaceae bacterium]|uniref:DUF6160 family protein n=1 Tax=Paucibacter sp. KCTC 42545 TaxID=1768242 RepID=UPI000733BC31|nr:DUF6160 family protein [Paucibacter sp. KCTC 42545]ALT79403.1 hypothetical protein AT984_21585 [Paucibacter sp. KCTC 42545]MBY0234510.1 hypothetical protein [Burkholderiaceae bacterium]